VKHALPVKYRLSHFLKIREPTTMALPAAPVGLVAGLGAMAERISNRKSPE
jgi:hypothetical protein